jgi:multicomponent Na+:H+ antiporter subunit G
MGESSAWRLVSAALLGIGVLFMLLGAVGLLRMPDVYMRIQAAAKTSTLGLLCVFGAVAIELQEAGAAARAVAVVLLEAEPHSRPSRSHNAASLSGTQVAAPHTLATPLAPQVSPPLHAPQLALRVAPQLSVAVTRPHSLPRRVQSAAWVSG